MISFHQFLEGLSNREAVRLAASLMGDEDRVLNIKPTADNDHLLRLVAYNRGEIEKAGVETSPLIEKRRKAVKELEDELKKRGITDIDAEIEKLFRRR